MAVGCGMIRESSKMLACVPGPDPDPVKAEQSFVMLDDGCDLERHFRFPPGQTGEFGLDLRDEPGPSQRRAPRP